MSDMHRSMWDEEDAAEGEGYRVLARKYRPRDFTDLIGQAPIVRTLTNAFETGRIAQAYMLTGVRGVGKTTTARILARALNYETDDVDRPTIDLRATGVHCKAIMEGRHVDVIEMDAASHTGIDDIREIIEQVRYRPVSARYKVYIIDEVHMLSTQAFNGLLKTLEEPPEHVKFIFATTEIRKVPITVLSRCQRFDLRRIDAGVLVEHFRRVAAAEKIDADDLSLKMIARAAEGSVRDGLSLMDQAIAHGGGAIEAEAVRAMLGLADRGRVIDLFEHVASGDVAAALDEFKEQYDTGANPPVVLTDLADFTHLVTRLKFVPEAANDPSLSETERERGRQFSSTLGVPVLSRFWQMLLKGISETENSDRPFAAAEMVLIRLTHAASLPGPEETARQIREMVEQTNGGRDGPVPTPNGGAAESARPHPGHSSAQAGIRRAAGAAAAPMLRAVEPTALSRPGDETEQSASERAEPAGKTAAEEESVPVAGLEDMVDLATRHRDIKMKTLIRTCLKPVRIEPGRLEVALTPEAPKSLPGDLGVALEKWTGRRWIVTLSREAGGATIAERENEKRESLVRDAREDPDVKAILERFPGARIIDVKIRADENDAAGLAGPGEEGDILADDQADEAD